ncbi:MAG: prolyl oligopeptidase family serine peptidase [Asticcacaulis sp.]
MCATLAARYDEEAYVPVDSNDQLSARPCLAAPIYPVISMRPEIAHQGSRSLLLGASPDESLIRRYSIDEQITRKVPPVFLAHAEDDASVPVEHSLRLRAALKAVNVRVETHLFASGGHGFGLRRPQAQWGDAFLRFAETCWADST